MGVWCYRAGSDGRHLMSDLERGDMHPEPSDGMADDLASQGYMIRMWRSRLVAADDADVNPGRDTPFAMQADI